MPVPIRFRQRTQRNKPILRLDRLLFQHHFPIQRRHPRVVGRIVLLFGIPRPQLLFTRVLGDTQLIEIVLLFFRDDSIAQQQRMLGRVHLHILPTGE